VDATPTTSGNQRRSQARALAGRESRFGYAASLRRVFTALSLRPRVRAISRTLRPESRSSDTLRFSSGSSTSSEPNSRRCRSTCSGGRLTDRDDLAVFRPLRLAVPVGDLASELAGNEVLHVGLPCLRCCERRSEVVRKWIRSVCLCGQSFCCSLSVFAVSRPLGRNSVPARIEPA
jgi:hypothetical protein